MIWLLYILVTVLCIQWVYHVVMLLLGMLYGNSKTDNLTVVKNTFVYLIPAYRCDDVIIDTVKKIKRENPNSLIYVVGDHLKISTFDSLEEDVEVLALNLENSTKVKSLKRACEKWDFTRFDYVILLDADNIPEPELLLKLNTCLSEEDRVVQLNRSYKNKNNSIAVLDAVSEYLNNMVYRFGPSKLGFSVPLIGSGIVFKSALFAGLINSCNAVGGFDKELDLKILDKGLKTKYFGDCKVYDEKVDSLDNFTNQRRRWLSTQFIFGIKAIKGLFIRSKQRRLLDYIHRVFQLWLLPRSVLTLLWFIVLGVVFYWSNSQFWIFALFTGLIFAMHLLSIPKDLSRKLNAGYLLKVFQLSSIMVVNLLRLKGVNKRFVHTAHKTKFE